MSLRCNCSDHGDDTVFGPCYKCSPNPETPPTERAARMIEPKAPRWVETLSDDVEPGDLG